MSDRELGRDGEYYWPQSEIVYRFEALRKDFEDMISTHVDIATRKVRSGRWSIEDAEFYAEGLEDVSSEMGFCLENRFGEITRLMR